MPSSAASTKLRYGTPDEAGMSADRIDRVRDLSRRWVEQDVHQCLAVLVARCLYATRQRRLGRVTPSLTHREAFSPPSASRYPGLMLWFSRKTLSGSYCVLIFASRA
jgi:hypothetical protein